MGGGCLPHPGSYFPGQMGGVSNQGLPEKYSLISGGTYQGERGRQRSAERACCVTQALLPSTGILKPGSTYLNSTEIRLRKVGMSEAERSGAFPLVTNTLPFSSDGNSFYVRLITHKTVKPDGKTF